MSSEDQHWPALIDAPELARIDAQLATLVSRSMHEALKKTDLAGRVEVRAVKEVTPEN
jgi:hypothetical protein